MPMMGEDEKIPESGERLILTMEGLPQDSGYVDLGLLVATIGACMGLMRKIAGRCAKKKGGGLRFLTAELSHASPTVVGIVPLATDSRVAQDSVADVDKILRQIEVGQMADIPGPEFNAVGEIIAPYEKKGIAAMSIQRVNGSANEHLPVVVTPKYLENFARGREEEFRGVTTVAGRVEMLNLHGDPIKLKIYPEIGDPIICNLPRDAKDVAMRAIGRRAAVTGKACYRADANRPGILRPYRIDAKAEKVEVFEFGPDTPQLTDFQGAFPNLTGGKDTLVYLRELRGEEN